MMLKTRMKELRYSDMLSHVSGLGYLPRWCVLLLDVLLCFSAYWLAILIGEGVGVFNHNNLELHSLLWMQCLCTIVVQVLCFWIFHTYSGILRYSTFVDTLKTLFAVLMAGILLLIANLIMRQTTEYYFLTTAIIIYVLVAFVLLFCLRVGVKTLFESMQQSAGNPKVLIYGTKAAGIAIAKMLRSAGNTPYRPVGFITDPNDKQHFQLVGMKVFPLNEKLIEYMQARNIRNVIVSPIKMQEINPAKDLQLLIDNNIHILTTPYFTQFESTSEQDAKRMVRIDAIQIEDLLERPSININTENVRNIISKKVVMVTGAAGSIGSELVRQVQKYNPKAIILLEQAESPLHDLKLDLSNKFPNTRFIPVIADVRNRERVEEVFADFRPDVVYHAAAYKHVPLMESHPNEAIRANVMGTKNMADMAVKYGVERFVMISTDKAVNPTNIMGASKRIAEIYVQSLFKQLQKENPNCTKFITTRFGNVLGSNGSVIPYFKKQIAAGGPVTVTHPDIIRYFMTIPEACCLVMEASTLGNGGEIFVFDMGHPVKILDLAKNMIRLAGYIPGEEIPIVFTGLRPGEKLYEELLNQKETTIPTNNEKIMVARVREFPFDEVSKNIDALIELTQHNKPFMTVQKMKEIVPEFISKNSVYEQLDK